MALAGTAGGASPRADGWLTLGNVCTAGMWTMDSIEIDELNYPLRVEERMLLPDSEGAGRVPRSALLPRGLPAERGRDAHALRV